LENNLTNVFCLSRTFKTFENKLLEEHASSSGVSRQLFCRHACHLIYHSTDKVAAQGPSGTCHEIHSWAAEPA